MDNNNLIWLVQVTSHNGQLVATKDLVNKMDVAGELEADALKGTVVLVHLKTIASLQTAFVTSKAKVPLGIIPVVDVSSSSHSNKNTHMIWVNLAFLKSESKAKNHQKSSTGSGSAPATSGQSEQKTADDVMTEKQRRYLFRLLAQQNITGNQAENYLKKALNTDDLTKANKKTASELIDQLASKGDSYA